MSDTRRMPRTKSKADRKTRTIQIRVTDAQLALLELAAGAAHLELSTWIRYLALSDAESRFGASTSATKKVRR